MPKPPPPPAAVLARLLRVSTFEGRTVFVIGAGGGVLSALFGDWFGAVVGALVAGAGAVELHGGQLLRNGQGRGMNWLVRSQLLLGNTILLYCAIRLLTISIASLDADMTPDLRAALSQYGMGVKEFEVLSVKLYRLVYSLVAALTLLYQGGMALYYHRRRKTVAEALSAVPPQLP